MILGLVLLQLKVKKQMTHEEMLEEASRREEENRKKNVKNLTTSMK